MLAAPFVAYGPSHLAAIAVLAVGIVAFLAFGRWTRRPFDRAFAVAIVVIAVPVQLLQFTPAEWDLQTSLPLQLCDWAWLVAAVALWTRSRLAATITYLWGLTLTTQAIATPALTTPFPGLRWWMFWAIHLLIVWAAIHVIWGMKLHPTWRTYAQTVAITVSWLFVTFRFNVLGFGLFAILSIIRLRSSAVTQQEVAYYFVALVLGLVNGMRLDDRWLVVAVNALLLVTMFVVDSRPLRDRARRMDVTLDVVHDDDAALVADLERRLGGRVMHHEVNEVDYVRDTMVVDVRYRAGRRSERSRTRTSDAWRSPWTWCTTTTPRWSPTWNAGWAGGCCTTRSRRSTTCATPWTSRCATSVGSRLTEQSLGGHVIAVRP